jgi:hypothetical protein
MMISVDQITIIARDLIIEGSSKQRIHALWAISKYAARPGVLETLLQLAVDTNLIDRAGYWTGTDIVEHRRPYGRDDVEHVIRWGLRGWNSFETGVLT